MIALVSLIFVFSIVAAVPIAFAVGLSVYIPMILNNPRMMIALVQRLVNAMDSFPLMAIPLFILAGEMMVRCELTKALLDFSNLIIGRVRGGLGHVNILASMLFAGISGSGLADAAGLGAIEIPMMLKGGYDKETSCAVTAASAVIGPIIPPSILAVLYAVADPRVSIAAIFMGGVVPGVLLGLALMVIVYVVAKKRNFPLFEKKFTLKEKISLIVTTAPALVMPLIIIGGILGGIFTPTEAGGVATFYALILGLIKKKLNFKILVDVFYRTALVTSAVFIIIGMANGLTWLLITEQVPQVIVRWFMTISRNPLVFLLFANILLLVTGALIDIAAALIVLVPILAPIAFQIGVDPLHFAVVLIVNLSMGMITPPVGNILFIVSGLGDISLARLAKAVMPYFGAQLCILVLITYNPDIVLFLPRMLGLYR